MCDLKKFFSRELTGKNRIMVYLLAFYICGVFFFTYSFSQVLGFVSIGILYPIWMYFIYDASTPKIDSDKKECTGV